MAGENKPWRDQAQGNPCKGVERNQEQAKERFLSPAEIAAVVEGLDTCGHTSAADCLRLIMLTGCRPGEAMLATWAQFDAQPGFWIKPTAIPSKGRSIGCPWARRRCSSSPTSAPGGATSIRTTTSFRASGQASRCSNCAPAGTRSSSHAGLTNIRIYDLRHTFARPAPAAGLSLPLIGRLLGHTQARTTKRYAHLADDPLREAADKIASAITKAGKRGKVVRLRGGE